MRENYEDSGFNPFKVGIIGALLIAAAVASLLGFRTYSETKLGRAAAEQQLDQLKTENAQLEKKIKAQEEDSQAKATSLKKELQQRESKFADIVRQKDYEGRAADAHIAQMDKKKTELEAQLAQSKKDLDQKGKDIKQLQDQLTKLQADLQKARSDADRNAKSYQTLKDKLDNIQEGDKAAADEMVQELADARQALKREQSERKKLEEELQALRQPADQQQEQPQ
jgi:chromosome segregation ATPase